MAFNQSQQFDGLFSISAPIGHNQAQNAILFCRKPQYFGIARLFENISGQPPFRVMPTGAPTVLKTFSCERQRLSSS